MEPTTGAIPIRFVKTQIQNLQKTLLDYNLGQYALPTSSIQHHISEPLWARCQNML